MKLIYYTYVLIHPVTKKPIYAGSTMNPMRRKAEHVSWYRKILDITPIFKIKKTATSLEKILRMEQDLIKKIKTSHAGVRNKRIGYAVFVKGKRVNTYQPKVNWVYLTNNQRSSLFANPQWGEPTKISKSCNYSAATIQNCFAKRPIKIHPELLQAISLHRNITITPSKKLNPHLLQQ